MSGKPGQDDVEERIDQDTQKTPYEPDTKHPETPDDDSDVQPTVIVPHNIGAASPAMEEVSSEFASKEELLTVPEEEEEFERPEEPADSDDVTTAPESDELIILDSDDGAASNDGEEDDTADGADPGDEDGGGAPSEPADEDVVMVEDESDEGSATDAPDDDSVPPEDESDPDDPDSEESDSSPMFSADNGDGITIDAGTSLDSAGNSGSLHFGTDESRLTTSNEGYLSAGGDNSNDDSLVSDSGNNGSSLDDNSTITAGGSADGNTFSLEFSDSGDSLSFGDNPLNVGTIELTAGSDPDASDSNSDTFGAGQLPDEGEQDANPDDETETGSEDEGENTEPTADDSTDSSEGDKPVEDDDLSEPIDFTPEPGPEEKQGADEDDREDAPDEEPVRIDLSGGSNSILDAIDVFGGDDNTKGFFDDSDDGDLKGSEDDDDDDEDLDGIF